jgi:hypothetical protein
MMNSPQLPGFEDDVQEPVRSTPKKVDLKTTIGRIEKKQRKRQGLLNKQQFLPITEVQKLKSGDFYPKTVKDIFENRYNDPVERKDTWGNYKWEQLKKDVAREGITNPLMVKLNHGDPKYDGNQELLNGHHRTMVAIEQGHMFVPVTEKWQDTETGMEGHYRKNDDDR